jgi:putative membrane protein
MALFVIRYAVRLGVLFTGIALSSIIIPGIETIGPWPVVKAALLLSMLNMLAKPVVVILTLPITLLSLGLFLIVINGFMFWLVGYAVSGFDVSGILPAILGSIVVSIINLLLFRFV